MDYKRNRLFFNHKRTKRWTCVSYVSYAFFAIAVLLFVATGLEWLVPSMPFAVIGVAILLTALSMITSEAHIKQQIALLQEGAREAALEHFGYPNQNPDLFFEFEGYDLCDPTLTLRKNRNGRVFSTRYVITYFMLEKDLLRIWEKKSSLVDDSSEIITRDVPLTELLGAEILAETNRRVCNDGIEKDIPHLAVVVRDKNQNVLITANCKIRDYDMDRLIENLAHAIKRTQENEKTT